MFRFFFAMFRQFSNFFAFFSRFFTIFAIFLKIFCKSFCSGDAPLKPRPPTVTPPARRLSARGHAGVEGLLEALLRREAARRLGLERRREVRPPRRRGARVGLLRASILAPLSFLDCFLLKKTRISRSERSERGEMRARKLNRLN